MGRCFAISSALTGSSVNVGAMARRAFNRASVATFTTRPVACRVFNASRCWRSHSVDSGSSPIKNSGVIPGRLSARRGCRPGCRLRVTTGSNRASSSACMGTVGPAIAAVAISSMAGITCFMAASLMRRVTGFSGGKRRRACLRRDGGSGRQRPACFRGRHCSADAAAGR